MSAEESLSFTSAIPHCWQNAESIERRQDNFGYCLPLPFPNPITQDFCPRQYLHGDKSALNKSDKNITVTHFSSAKALNPLIVALAASIHPQEHNMYLHAMARRFVFFTFTFAYPLTAGVVGAPTDDFATTFLNFSLFSTALWDLANTRPVRYLMLSSHLFFSLPCLLPQFTVTCKIVLARPDERETWAYHFSLRLFAMVRGSSCGPIAC